MPANIDITVNDVDTYRNIPIGIHETDQIVLQTNGTLRGLSPGSSVVKKTDPSSITPLVTSANYSLGGTPQFTIEHCKFIGNQGLATVNNGFPYGSAPEIALSAQGTSYRADCLLVDGWDSQILYNKIDDFRGDGINNQISAAVLGGQITLQLIEGNRITHCYTGIKNRFIDTQIYGNTVCDVRDYGFLDASNGAIQMANNHFYGARTACQWGTDFAQLIGPNKSVNDTCSDAFYGFMNLSSNEGTAWALFSQHCWCVNAYLLAKTDLFAPIIRLVRTSDEQNNAPDYDGSTQQSRRIVGIKMEGKYCRVLGGQIFLNDYQYPSANFVNNDGSIGIKMMHGQQTVKDVKITFQAAASRKDQWGVWVPYMSVASTQREYKTIDVEFQNFEASLLDGNTGIWGVYVADSAFDGGHNTVNIKAPTFAGTDGTSTDKRLRLPTNWNVGGVATTNKAYINGVEITANVYPPP